jgi:hypothetical protein
MYSAQEPGPAQGKHTIPRDELDNTSFQDQEAVS